MALPDFKKLEQNKTAVPFAPGNEQLPSGRAVRHRKQLFITCD